MATAELPATTLSAERIVTSPASLASPEPARTTPSPVNDVTMLSFRMICGAVSEMTLEPAAGWMPLEVISERRR